LAHDQRQRIKGLTNGMEVPMATNAATKNRRLKQSEVEALYDKVLAASPPLRRKFLPLEPPSGAVEAQPTRPSLVYFIGSELGQVKIGMARVPERRLRELQTSHPAKLTILATCEGGHEREQGYHRKFAAHRLHGEWFERCPEIEAEIARLTTPTPERPDNGE
jgi:hypothetical protein